MRIHPLPATLVAMPVLAAVAGPYWLGGRAEVAYRAAIAEMERQPQALRIIEQDYRRGWFSSTASLEFAPEGSDQDTDLRVRVVSNIAHGPRSAEGLTWPPAVAEIGSLVSLEHPVIQLDGVRVDTHLAWNGGGVADIRIPAIDQPPIGDAPGLRSSSGIGELSFSPEGPSVGHFDLSSLEVLGEDGSALLRLRNLHAEHSTRPWLPGVLVGTGEFTIAEVLGQSPEAAFEVKDLAIHFDARPDGELLMIGLHYGVGVLHIGTADYGPSQLKLSASRLDGQTLSTLQQDLVEVNDRALPEAMAEIAAAGVLMKHLPALVATEPQVAIDHLDLMTPDGLIQGRLSIGVRGLKGADVMAGTWLKRLVADGELSLPREIAVSLLILAQRERLLEEMAAKGLGSQDLTAEQEHALESSAATQVDTLAKEGWIKTDGARISSVIVLADGLLTVNGQPLPLDAALSL